MAVNAVASSVCFFFFIEVKSEDWEHLATVTKMKALCSGKDSIEVNVINTLLLPPAAFFAMMYCGALL